MTKEIKFTELEEPILELLKACPRSTRAVADKLGIAKDDAWLVIRRLKDRNRALLYNGRWHECPAQVKVDTSVFPRPPYQTRAVGFYW